MCEEVINKNGQSEDFYNVAIFIDYENVHKTLTSKYQNAIRLGFFEKLKVWCKNHSRRIVKIAVYCNFDNKDLYESKHQSFLQSYGVETIHTSNQGKNYADLKLAIDVLNAMYTNDNIDEFIVMSNDKDMTPLLNTVRMNKRKASILTTGTNFNPVLCEFADEQIRFEDIIDTPYVGKLHISETDTNFLEDIKKYVDKYLEEIKSSQLSSAKDSQSFVYKKHYNLDYFIPIQSDYYNVMQYELLNIIHNYLSDGKIILYNSSGNPSYIKIAVLPIEYKDDFIRLRYIKESDIFSSYDIEKDVKDKYEQYWKKDKQNA